MQLQDSTVTGLLPAQPLILLAEDNPANIDTFSAYLTSCGFRLIVATNGQEAINLAQQQPDLILMDIQMPGMDGLEAIRQIRADCTLTNVPIIAVTALAMAGDRDKCLAAGATDYLAKPVSLKQLKTMIQQLLLEGGQNTLK
ncbi:response regulator [Nostoc sp. FACHB-145]|uniref:response regulator n=1 Tax=Nostoc sp. FACHB-145 TaxID=2692836 RepID=UPI0018F059D5|nr:response regulator [Nostoc sp. FACHB-145]